MSDPGTASPDLRLPRSAWVMGWLFLVGQVAELLPRGVSQADPVWIVVSILLSAVVIRWFASGVLTARTVRLAIVWIILSAATAFGFVEVAVADTRRPEDVVTFAFSLAQLIALGVFCTTGYFKDRRVQPNVPAPVVAPLLLLAVATGAIAGLTTPPGESALSSQLTIQV